MERDMGFTNPIKRFINAIGLTVAVGGAIGISLQAIALTGQDIASAANKRTEHFVVYTGRYVSIDRKSVV